MGDYRRPVWSDGMFELMPGAYMDSLDFLFISAELLCDSMAREYSYWHMGWVAHVAAHSWLRTLNWMELKGLTL